MADGHRRPSDHSGKRLYVWMATGPDGREAVLATQLDGSPDLTMLAGPDRDLVESYRSIAEETRRETGYPILLTCFSQREDIVKLS